jgi:hypothetical protein
MPVGWMPENMIFLPSVSFVSGDDDRRDRDDEKGRC